ncbi:hypothetical protein [Rubritalea profundi]|uniref:Lipoprotein n=1 Tax=Rubritalea profundi TaxID=1658618 RepID=A0A2S7TZ37_9BACT|nr:hypothetical protein [Rubritalea profundi]PQJ27590.1 hypothetical protein BSZ32_03165 [Rubritalea profundi]
MMKHLITQAIVLICISLFTVGCGSPRPTATAGSWVGRGIAMPIGFTVAALDEVLKQTGDIAAANPRYDTDQTGDTTAANPKSDTDQNKGVAVANPKYGTNHNPVAIMVLLTVLSIL